MLRVRVVAVLGGCALTGSLSPREVGSWTAVGILAFGCAAVWLTLRHQPDRHRLRWIGAAATAIDAGGIALLLTTISDLQPANSAWLLTALVVAEAAVRWDLLGGMLAGLGAAVGSALWAWARLGSHATAGEVVGPVAALLVFGMTAGVGMRRLRALAKSMAAQSERLQTALEVSGTVTWDYDIPRDHLVVSENFERLVGLPAADFSAFSDALMRMVHPDDRVGIDAEVARGEFRNEYRLILPGGRVRWMRASGQILTDREGAPIRSVGVATDVTARQTADDARRDAEAVLGTTIDLATYAAIGMDDAGRISEWSPAAEQLFGWTSDEILGRDAGSAIVPVRNRDSQRFWWQRVATGPAPLELTFVRKDGGELAAEVTVVASSRGGPTSFEALVRDIGQRSTLQARLTRQALLDPLTFLAGRTLLTYRLNQAIARLSRQHSMLAVLLIDLDHFTVINDSLGQLTGDEILRTIGQRLTATIRPPDTVARSGGDEFLIVAEDVGTESDALRLARRLAAAVARPLNVAGTEIVITASVGVARTTTSGRDVEGLLRDSDAAMHRAKGGGRARCELFGEAIRNQVLSRMELEQQIRRGVDHAEFEVHYQPIVEIAGGRPVQAEALVRWRHPTRGLIGPSGFIAMAKETGEISRIGAWVLRTACAEAAGWPSREGEPPLQVCVNLSARELADPQLVQRVRRALRTTDLDPARLCLEIAETTVMDQPERTATILNHLRELGLRIAVDDFGTGYTSLLHLRRFPVDLLKVDRAFVGAVTDQVDDATIVRLVIRLAQELRLTSVAEGVENRGQRDMLEWLGCDLGQGYLWSRPLPAPEFRRWLAGYATAPMPESS